MADDVPPHGLRRGPARLAAARALRFGIVAAGLGCTVDPSGSDIPAPSLDRIYVFYPSGIRVADGLVRGRGLSGAIPPEGSHALIESYPTGNRRVVPVEGDGAFEFEIIAISGDTLEIRAATSPEAEVVGAPAFVRVPASIQPFVPHVCCPETSTCQSIYDRESGVECEPFAPGLVRCDEDADCAVFENEYLPLDESQVSVSAPDEAGNVVVEGQVIPNVLVTLANVGKSALAQQLDPDDARRRGLADPGVRLTRIADDQGRFRFDEVPAIADDEIVVQLFDLNGYRSPSYAQRVPDPPLAGVDILGVFPWEPLTNGEIGKVAIRLAPYGSDSRGICPDQASPRDGLELCAGGGLDHGMVSFNRAQLDQPENPAFSLAPVPTSTDANTPYNRGVEGNVRSRGLDLFVVLDMSASASAIDGGGLAFEAVRAYVENLRDRDRVGLITFEAVPRLETDLVDGRPVMFSRLRELAMLPRSGENGVLAAVGLAAERLNARGPVDPGRIVVITFGAPSGMPEQVMADLEGVLDIVERRQSGVGLEGHAVDVVGVQLSLSDPNVGALEDLATFSRGSLLSLASPNDLVEELSNLRGEQVGSFILLYDMAIPVDVGKAGRVFIDLSLRVPGGSPAQRGSYEGLLRIANAPNP